MSNISVPHTLNGSRACLICHIIQNFEQFLQEGCSNCENFLQLKGSKNKIISCTSDKYEGMIASMSPGSSSAAKWLGLDHYVIGVYALSVEGELPTPIREAIVKRRGYLNSRNRSK